MDNTVPGRPRHQLPTIALTATVALAVLLTPVTATPATTTTSSSAGKSTTATAQSTTPATTATSALPIEPKPVDMVVLVDESGSLADGDVAAERDAAAVIAQSEIAVKSTVSVIGFGGNTGRSGQSPVDIVCQPTTVSTGPDRDYLAHCVSGLHRRSAAEGTGTDFPRALSQALSVLGNQPLGYQKVVFLLTDGKLDVAADPSYGQNRDQRNAVALQRMNAYLRQANTSGVQVWPLGFGSGIDTAQLADFARLGSQHTCGIGSPSPRARNAVDASAVIASLVEAYAAARCAAGTTPRATRLPSGSSRTIGIDVPVLATDGSIAVHKRDPRVAISYLDPDGVQVPKTGPLGDSSFQVSGENSAVEVLRVVNPKPGRWRVRLTSGPEVPTQQVTAWIIWQGAIRSTVSIDPPAPEPGRVAVVQVTLLTRQSALTDPAALRAVDVRARLTGTGFRPVPVSVSDDGTGPDPAAGDGTFTGQVTVPSTATGEFRVVGEVGGPGVASDERPFTGVIAAGPVQVRTQVRLPSARVAPGGSLTGSITATNASAVTHRIAVQLTEPDDGTYARVDPPTADVAAAGTTRIDIRVVIDRRSLLGPASARLRVTDANAPTTVYADVVFTWEIGYPPPLWRRLLWLWITLGALAVAGVAGAGYRGRLRADRRRVDGLVFQLSRDGTRINHLYAPVQGGDRFPFVIRDEATGQARLDASRPDEPRYEARRDRTGVVVTLPSGGEVSLVPDRPAPLASGLELTVRDDRPARAGNVLWQRRRRPDQPFTVDETAHSPWPSRLDTRPDPESDFDDELL